MLSQSIVLKYWVACSDNCYSVSEYLMGDLGSITLTKEGKVDKTKVRAFIGCGCEEWGRGKRK